MKILCVADHVDPLVYSSHIKERFKDVDLILGAGDLRLSYYDYIVSSLNKPLLFIFGNHHLTNLKYYRRSEDAYEANKQNSTDIYREVGGIYINRKTVRIKNLIIAGLGGSHWYNGEENQHTQLGMYINVIGLVPRLLWSRIVYGRYVDVLLTHAPPFGINDQPDRCHRGFKAFLWMMKVFKPRYLIHGHIHLYSLNENRITRYRDTVIINAYDHFVLDIEEGAYGRQSYKNSCPARFSQGTEQGDISEASGFVPQ